MRLHVPLLKQISWTQQTGIFGLVLRRFFSDSANFQDPNSSFTAAEFEKISELTLERLADTFECLAEKFALCNQYDVEHAYGVLKVNFGPPVGTYIINRQAPNKQLWLSSPLSGPKRYDYDLPSCSWVYKHDRKSLHKLLSEEISQICGDVVEFPT